MGGSEKRKNRRFELHLPLRLVRVGFRSVTGSGETKNLSSCGVLFVTAVPVDVGDPIEYYISLPSGQAPENVSLHCIGKVVRCLETEQEDSPATVAATLERYEFVRTTRSK